MQCCIAVGYLLVISFISFSSTELPSNQVSQSASASAVSEAANSTDDGSGGPELPTSLQLTPNRTYVAPINNKLLILAKDNARDLVKIIIPLLRCEQIELRESVICGLSRIQPAAFRFVHLCLLSNFPLCYSRFSGQLA